MSLHLSRCTFKQQNRRTAEMSMNRKSWARSCEAFAPAMSESCGWDGFGHLFLKSSGTESDDVK